MTFFPLNLHLILYGNAKIGYGFEIESNISELMRRNNVEKIMNEGKSMWRLICVVKMSIDADLEWKWFNNKQETNVCNYSCVFLTAQFLCVSNCVKPPKLDKKAIERLFTAANSRPTRCCTFSSSCKQSLRLVYLSEDHLDRMDRIHILRPCGYLVERA